MHGHLARHVADLNSLNERQRLAVTTVDSPCCVQSIPGSGKTKTVTEKIVHLLTGHEIGLWSRPRSVMAVTFTHEAGKELTERTRKKLGASADQRLMTGTFHGLFLQSLKRIGAEAANRRLASPGQAKQYLHRALQACLANQWAAATTDQAKDELLRQFEKVRTQLCLTTNDNSAPACEPWSDDERALAEAVNAYKDMMRAARMLDFGMILEESLLFLRSHGRAIERTPEYKARVTLQEREAGYQLGWSDELPLFIGASHMLVDEAQDIDDIQLAIILEVAEQSVIVDLIGDDDQSIYSFRAGLGQKGMERFIAATNATTILLENNYRCRREVLELAGEIIRQNRSRTPKLLHAQRGRGGSISLNQHLHGDNELDTVCSAIASTNAADGEKPSSKAVICRINKVLDLVQKECGIKNIVHERLGGASIWGDAPICFMTGYLDSLLRGGDRSGVDQCLYWAGATTVTKKSNDRSSAMIARLSELTATLKPLANSTRPEDVRHMVSGIYGWFAWAVKTSSMSTKQKAFNISRLEIATEVLAGIEAVHLGRALTGETDDDSLSADRNNRSKGLKGSLRERLRALTKLDRTGKNEPGAVKIVSMHGAKGLEFDHVWLISLDDGTIPGTPEPEDPDDALALANFEEALEEERRLLYVAITRAKDHLHLSWSARPIHKPLTKQLASECRFLAALPFEKRPRSTTADSASHALTLTV